MTRQGRNAHCICRVLLAASVRLPPASVLPRVKKPGSVPPSFFVSFVLVLVLFLTGCTILMDDG